MVFRLEADREIRLFSAFLLFFFISSRLRILYTQGPPDPHWTSEFKLELFFFFFYRLFFSPFLLSFFFTQLLFFMKIFVPSTNSHFYHFDLELSPILLGNFVWGYPQNFEKLGVFAVARSAAWKAASVRRQITILSQNCGGNP